MPKKQPRNAFFYFMQDLQDQYVRQGIRKPSMAEMSAIASPKWNKLSAEEKDRYNQMAARMKNQEKQSGDGRLTSDGRLIAEVEAELHEKEQETLDMKRDVQALIFNFDSLEDIANHDFLIMTFNILCRTDEPRDLPVYIPNEVGIVKFNLNEGIKDTFHRFIDPGQIPHGYTGDAKAHSESTHQIPIFARDFDEYDSNYSRIYQDIRTFSDVGRGKTMFAFCMPDDIAQNVGCMTWLHENGCAREKQQIGFADVTYLLMELAAAAEVPFSAESLATDVLNQHSFDYSPNTRCDFHEDLDNAFCALAYPYRISYLLCDKLCPMYGNEVTENHLPRRISKTIMVETWEPKEPIRPVINKINVPLKEIQQHQPSTLQFNAKSKFSEDDSTIVPSMAARPSVMPKSELVEEIPDIDDDDEFPSLGNRMRAMDIRNMREEGGARQPRSVPNIGLGRGNPWQGNMGRGSLVNPHVGMVYPSNFAPAAGTSQLSLGFGRGIKKN